jgi:diguanylate cyclase
MELPMTADVRKITLSVGLTTVVADAETSFDHLYGRADLALYEAKRQGRNRTVVHA